MRSDRLIRRAVAAATLALLAGCADTDPYQKVGQWQPTGANALNLAAMVANPADLVRGRGSRGAIGKEATAPVDRLMSGKVAALPNASSQESTPGPAAAPPSAGN